MKTNTPTEPIRVLHLLDSMNRGGAENALMNYYRHIDRKKVQFDFLLSNSQDSLFADEIIALGGRVFGVHPMHGVKDVIPYSIDVIRFFRAHPEYTIVHSHTSSKSVLPLWIAKQMGIPIRISHSHSSRTEQGLKGNLRNFLKPFLLRVANYYCSCGKEAAIWLYGEKAVNKGLVTIIPNAIEGKRFTYNESIRNQIRKALYIDDSVYLIGMVGRFNVVKNHLFAIDAFKVLSEKCPFAKLILIGGGELYGEIEKRVIDLSLSDKVIFTGVVPNVNDYEQAMDLFIMPSLYEGIPLSVVEAQIAGLPCLVSTGVPKEVSLTELVFFSPLDVGPSAWAEEMIRLRSNKRRSHALEVAAKGYEAETAAVLLQEYYLGLLATLNK